MLDIHEKMIADRETKIEILKAEIRVLKELQGLSQGGKAIPVAGKRNRPLKTEWADIMKYIGGKPKHLDSIKEYADLMGHEISNDTLRGQLAGYVNQGWLERVSPGTFKLTDSGAIKCGYTHTKENAPEGALDF